MTIPAPTSTPPETHHLRDELTALRDTLRVKMHLASLAVRDEWDRLEPQVREVEHRLAEAPLAEATRKMARDVHQAMRELLERRLPQPRVADVMTEAPRTCRGEARLSEAAQIMREVSCGAVPVVDARGRALGILTDRDVCLAALDGASLGRRVADVMSRDLVTCRPQDDLDVAAAAMIDHQVRRLVVTEDGKKVVGILALADLARHCHDRDLVARTLFAVSAPQMPPSSRSAQDDETATRRSSRAEP